MATRTIKLGLSMRQLGYHAGAWRQPAAPAGGAMDINHYLRIARKAEEGLFDMLFLADGVALRAQDQPVGSLCRSNQNVELEPLTMLSALAVLTEHIGLVATASTTYNEPYHVARKFASLDHISRGRAGWNIVTSWSEAEAWNFNRDRHLEYDVRYDRAAEFVEVVKGLWDSWESDAFVHDKSSGIFYDPGKLHVLDHKGPHFKVRGPLTLSRTPQGRPIMVQAGKSEQGQEIAASSADIVFSNDVSLDSAREYYASVKGRLAAHGRSRDSLLMLPGLMPIVGRTQEEALAKQKALDDLIDPLVGLAQVYGTMGDLSGYDLDGPVPEPIDPQLRSRAQVLLTLARKDNLTLRQLCVKACSGRGHRNVIGTPDKIVDAMEQWMEAGAADGFNIVPSDLPGAVDEFVDLVVPEMQRRGLYRSAYEGRTLRHSLGLADPVNRYEADRGGDADAA
jgi:FMN-dependent oxidoreductase (nitrilotriacetate monooxygenase family)